MAGTPSRNEKRAAAVTRQPEQQRHRDRRPRARHAGHQRHACATPTATLSARVRLSAVRAWDPDPLGHHHQHAADASVTPMTAGVRSGVDDVAQQARPPARPESCQRDAPERRAAGSDRRREQPCAARRAVRSRSSPEIDQDGRRACRRGTRRRRAGRTARRSSRRTPGPESGAPSSTPAGTRSVPARRRAAPLRAAVPRKARVRRPARCARPCGAARPRLPRPARRRVPPAPCGRSG